MRAFRCSTAAVRHRIGAHGLLRPRARPAEPVEEQYQFVEDEPGEVELPDVRGTWASASHGLGASHGVAPATPPAQPKAAAARWAAPSGAELGHELHHHRWA